MEYLEADKYDQEVRSNDLRTEIKQMRNRINDLTDAKRKSTGLKNLRK